MPVNRRRQRLRQAVWIACGVVVLTVLTVVISWLTAGTDPAKDPARAATAPVTPLQPERPTFTPEQPAGRDGVEPEPPPAPGRVEIAGLEAEALGSAPAQPPPLEPSAGAAPSPEPGQPPVAAPAPPPAPKPTPKAEAPPAPAPAAKPVPGGFGVQVGAFGSGTTAQEMKLRLEGLGYKVVLLPKGELSRVVVTGFADRPAAEAARDKLRAQGAPQAQVVPLD